MPTSARYVALLGAIAFLFLAGGPAKAHNAPACDAPKTKSIVATADRYNQSGQYADAARWYLSAAKFSGRCTNPSDALLSARSLTSAGLALAQNGDYLRALDLLRSVQAKLTAIGPSDRQTSLAVGALLDLVAEIVTRIQTVAKLSM